MSGTHKNGHIVIFSNDDKLKELIVLKLTNSDIRPDVDFHSELNVDSDATGADAVFYDADLVNGDLDPAKADIGKIKAWAPSTPIIVLGARDVIAALQASKRTWPLVKRWVKKPITASQLLMAVSAINSSQVIADKQSKSKSLNVGVGVLAGVLVAAGIAYVLFSGGESSPVTTSPAALDQIAVDDSAPQADAAAQSNALEVARLYKLATAAQANGELILPDEQNALGYYNQILELDTYHAQAYEQKWTIVKQLRNSFPDLLKAAEFEQARRTIDVLAEAEPFSGENNRMALALEKAQKSYQAEAAIADVATEAAPVDEVVVEPTAEQKALAEQQAAAEKANAEREQASLAAIKQNQEQQQAQALKAINAAMDSENLIPPQPQNAYSLLLDAVKQNSISDTALLTSRSRLSGLLVQRSRQEIDKSNIASARNYIDYIQKLDGRNQALPGLVASLQKKRAQISAAKAKAAQSKPKPVAANKANTPPTAKPAPAVEKPAAVAKSAGSGAAITPFRISKRANPKYPRRAYNLDIEGWVKLAFQVNEAGKAVNIEVIQAEPKKMFNKAAIEALEKWEFTPAKNAQTGEAVMSEKSDTQFNFSLGS